MERVTVTRLVVHPVQTQQPLPTHLWDGSHSLSHHYSLLSHWYKGGHGHQTPRTRYLWHCNGLTVNFHTYPPSPTEQENLDSPIPLLFAATALFQLFETHHYFELPLLRFISCLFYTLYLWRLRVTHYVWRMPEPTPTIVFDIVHSFWRNWRSVDQCLHICWLRKF